jgi:hypothetical protein
MTDDAAARAQEFAFRVKAAQIVRALRDGGVDVLLIKGAATKLRLYEREEIRPTTDIDVLVDPDHRGRAEARLAELGFAPGFQPEDDVTDLADHAGEWLRSSDSTWVDLHVNLPEVRGEPRERWAVLRHRRVTAIVAGDEVEVLDDAATALLAALHAAHHGSAMGAQPLEDLRRALVRLPPDAWTEALALARALDAEAAFADGLGLVPGGMVLAERFGLSAAPGVRRRLLWAGAPWGAVVLDELRARGSFRARAALVARLLVPPPGLLRQSTPLARRGRLGLTAAYLARPVRLLARLPAAALALRRARRDAR